MDNIFKLTNEKQLKIIKWENDNIHAYFSTSQGGSSSGNFCSLNLALHVDDDAQCVLNSRELYSEYLGVDLSNFVFANQTHSNNFYEVTKNDIGSGIEDFSEGIYNTDALYTFENNIVLNTFHADCTPVFFKSTKDNLIGVIHAGWQGTTKEITFATLKHVIDTHDILPENIEVVIGPSIGMSNFEVEYDVISKIKEMNNINIDGTYINKNENKFLVNVKELNLRQVTANGIDSVLVSDIDTFVEENLYSYRRNNITGRMCASIYQTNN